MEMRWRMQNKAVEKGSGVGMREGRVGRKLERQEGCIGKELEINVKALNLGGPLFVDIPVWLLGIWHIAGWISG